MRERAEKKSPQLQTALITKIQSFFSLASSLVFTHIWLSLSCCLNLFNFIPLKQSHAWNNMNEHQKKPCAIVCLCDLFFPAANSLNFTLFGLSHGDIDAALSFLMTVCLM